MTTDVARTRDTKRWWKVHDKDKYVCPDCGITNDDSEFTQWEVHHINKQDGKVVALCQVCHKVRHGAERRHLRLSAWKREFEALGG